MAQAEPLGHQPRELGLVVARRRGELDGVRVEVVAARERGAARSEVRRVNTAGQQHRLAAAGQAAGHGAIERRRDIVVQRRVGDLAGVIAQRGVEARTQPRTARLPGREMGRHDARDAFGERAAGRRARSNQVMKRGLEVELARVRRISHQRRELGAEPVDVGVLAHEQPALAERIARYREPPVGAVPVRERTIAAPVGQGRGRIAAQGGEQRLAAALLGRARRA